MATTSEGTKWVALVEPSPDELARVGREFALHPLALEDAVHAHQRAKLEFYEDSVFLVLRPALYIDETETVEFGELHVFAGRDFVVTIRRGHGPNLDDVRSELAEQPQLLSRGPMAIVHAIVDRVVDDYAPVVTGVENDIDEIETEVFGGEADASRRTYQLLREVIEFRRATEPLSEMLQRLASAVANEEERRYLRDVEDHAIRIQQRVDGFHELLRSILSVNLTLETKGQNEEVKKISAWAAILFAPTLVGTIYGMNFEHMPELDWRLGYPFALGLMAATSVGLYALFRRRRWI
jgi:magnesium transporter